MKTPGEPAGPAPPRSAALNGRDRVRPDRPDWAAPQPQGRLPLPVVTAEALARPGVAATAARLTSLARDLRAGEWPPEIADLRVRASRIRRETLSDLEAWVSAFAEKAQEAGAVVHRAAGAADARRVIGDIALGSGARLVAKSKSMATEEIHLNRHLEALGIEVVETDLGEHIIQLADERPAHLLAPAAHRSREQVAELFSAVTGTPQPPEPAVLARLARQRLRADFRAADMGVTGVNFAVAETGTIVLVTNEGNGRMVTSQPRVHVALMPMEKVIPRFSDLAVLLPLLAYAGAGQRVSAYQTLITGPRRPGEHDGPSELHIVVLDNGRSRIARGRYAEILACVRCGNCQIACPVFRTLGGGHAYQSTYGGPIGAVLTPLLDGGEQATDLPYLSSLCGACADACPVQIPLPDMLVSLRADRSRSRRASPRRLGWWLWGAAWSRPAAYRASLTALRALFRLAPTAAARRLPGPARAWAQGRTAVPLRNAGAFRAWARRRERHG